MDMGLHQVFVLHSAYDLPFRRRRIVLFEDHAFFVSHLFKDSGINFKQSLMEIVYVSYFSVQIHPVSFIFPSKLLQICWCDLRNPLAQKFQSLIVGYRISALDMVKAVQFKLQPCFKRRQDAVFRKEPVYVLPYNIKMSAPFFLHYGFRQGE